MTWHQYRLRDGDVVIVARVYWPTSTIVEVNNGDGWRPERLLLEINDDPSWEQVDETVVNSWLAAHAPVTG